MTTISRNSVADTAIDKCETATIAVQRQQPVVAFIERAPHDSGPAGNALALAQYVDQA